MIFSYSSSDYLPIGNIGLKLTGAQIEHAGTSLEFIIQDEYELGGSSFAEIKVRYSPKTEFPVSQMTFSDKSRILGVASRPDTSVLPMEDQILAGSVIFEEKTGSYRRYEMGEGLRRFSYLGSGIIYFPSPEVDVFSWENGEAESLLGVESLDKLIPALKKSLSLVEAILIVPPTHERCYLVSLEMALWKRKIYRICSSCEIDFKESTPDLFPE